MKIPARIQRQLEEILESGPVIFGRDSHGFYAATIGKALLRSEERGYRRGVRATIKHIPFHNHLTRFSIRSLLKKGRKNGQK